MTMEVGTRETVCLPPENLNGWLFGVSSYKTIRLEQYESVLAFLEEWRDSTVSKQGGGLS
jgi:hypothetical protein